MNGLVLDFTQNPMVVHSSFQGLDTFSENSMAIAQVVPIYEATNVNLAKVCAVSVDQEAEVDVVNDCAVPDYHAPPNIELPACTITGF